MISLYHGTDRKVAENIKNEGFRIKPSTEHWLGNGIYFYTDYDLAKWWTTNPSQKFGSRIHEPVIIRGELDENIYSKKILNLLKLQDYITYVEIFQNEFWKMFKKFNPYNATDIKKIRCAYCDFLSGMHGYKVIIGNFVNLNQPYNPQLHYKLIENMRLSYSEIQVCVFEQNIIRIHDYDCKGVK